MTLFSSFGYETNLQAPLVAALVPVPWKWPAGQTTGIAARFAIKTALCCIAATPAICGCDVVPQFAVQVGPCWLAMGPPRVLKSIPDEAVLAFKAIVLLMMFTLGESTSEIPAPSHPATLSTMMLLVTVAEFHCPGSSGKATMSDPLTAEKAMPPPVPLSAEFPMIRLALITSPGPTPSLGPIPATTILGTPLVLPEGGPQSVSMLALPLQRISASGVPMMSMPPPLAGIVGLML